MTNLLDFSALGDDIHRPGEQAQDFIKSVKDHIRALEEKLQKDERLVLIYSQSNERIFIKEVKYINPYTIVIFGQDYDGGEVSVLSHINSFQLMFKAVKTKSSSPRKPIGFI